MTSNYQRKADDNRIVELNNVGLSLTRIGELLNVHHTTVKYRLKALGIEPADTRRSFMEGIFESLSPSQQQWLIGKLHPGFTAKDLIRSMLVKEFINRAAPIEHTSVSEAA
jgi:hypothetical protein